jgi:cob(I)alamin adenosyltransferase
MKIYTKTGDAGETALIGGQRTSKSDTRIEAIGTVDELNAAVGYLQSMLPLGLEDISTDLQQIQHRLFDIGAMLANLSEKKGRTVKVAELSSSHVTSLEKRIDHYDKELTQLTAFILPGGTPVASLTHLARGVCRRAERTIVTVQRDHAVPSVVLKYINRLSDLFFTIARVANARAHVADVIWQKAESTS